MEDKRSNLYNDLVTWEKRKAIYAIHKRLLPFLYKEVSCNDVNDVLQIEFEALKPLRILDVGCGVGNTLIKLASAFNMQGHGISISNKEIVQAKKNIVALPHGKKIHFQQQSFDDPINFCYDKAIAIESLKHSFHLNHTASNLYQAADKDATIHIIDDFFKGANDSGIYAISLKKDWNLSNLYSKADFVEAFCNAGFEVQNSIDFTEHVLRKSIFMLQLKIAIFSLLEKVSFNSARKNLLAIFKSGFILELMFQKKQFTYECLIFRKPTESDDHFHK